MGFNLLNAFGIFPAKLIENLKVAMGWTQALTGVIAMFITYIVYYANRKRIKVK